jgi:hypothetical protein
LAYGPYPGKGPSTPRLSTLDRYADDDYIDEQAGTAMTREQELIKDGWQKRNIADEPRLSEAVELYESLGFDVRLEPVDIESEDCTECMKTEPDRYKVIYTRKRG